MERKVYTCGHHATWVADFEPSSTGWDATLKSWPGEEFLYYERYNRELRGPEYTTLVSPRIRLQRLSDVNQVLEAHGANMTQNNTDRTAGYFYWKINLLNNMAVFQGKVRCMLCFTLVEPASKHYPFFNFDNPWEITISGAHLATIGEPVVRKFFDTSESRDRSKFMLIFDQAVRLLTNLVRGTELLRLTLTIHTNGDKQDFVAMADFEVEQQKLTVIQHGFD